MNNTMKTARAVRLKRLNVGLSALALLLLVTSQASAMEFTITSSNCTGAGSLEEAIQSANANPGSTIRIPGGMAVNLNTCPINGASPVEPVFNLLADTTIVGDYNPPTNGQFPDLNQQPSIKAVQRAVTNDGKIQTNKCPEKTSGIQITATAPSLLRVGAISTNNPITVTMKNLRLSGLAALAWVEQGATLTIEDTWLDQIKNYNGNCKAPHITVGYSATLNMTDVLYFEPWHQQSFFADLPDNPNGLIYGSPDSKINLERVHVSDTSNQVLYNFNGVTNIVSSWFNNTGGFENDKGTMAVVNSAFNLYPNINPTVHASLKTTGSSARTKFVASTVIASQSGCSGSGQEKCVTGGYPLEANGGSVSLESSVINVLNLGDYGPLLGSRNGGTYAADEYTWIRPNTSQPAADLRALTQQPALLTDEPALTTQYDANRWLKDYAQPLVPGVLIDRVYKQSFSLRNPIDGSDIDRDVFGSNRFDGEYRDIGAVQIGTFANDFMRLAVSLALPPADGEVSLTWVRPKDPSATEPVSGYRLEYRVSGTTTWTEKLISGGNTLTDTVLGLTNGTEYQFQIRPIANGVDGPQSNRVRAMPATVSTAPAVTATPGDGELTVSWTAPTNDGGSPITDYYVALRDGAQYAERRYVSATGTFQVTFSHLVNGTSYNSEVIAINRLGGSAKGTASGMPLAPLQLTYPAVEVSSGGGSVSVSPYAQGLIGGESFSLVTALAGVSIDATSGVVTVIDTTATGSVTVRMTRGSDTIDATVTVTQLGSAPSPYISYVSYELKAGAAITPISPAIISGFAGTPTFALASGSDPLPSGLTLASDGTISGTPQQATAGATLSVDIEATYGTTKAIDAAQFVINPAFAYQPIVAELHRASTHTPTASGSLDARSFAVTSGALPAGLSLDPFSGVISGTPTVVEATSSVGVTYTTGTQTVTATVHVTVNAPTPQTSVVTGQGPGGVTASLSVMGCRIIDSAAFVAAPNSASKPAGFTFPFGLIDFVLKDCVQAANGVQIIVDYSQLIPGNGRFFKEEGGVYDGDAAKYQANLYQTTMRYQVTDNGVGDDDSTVTEIHDPSGIGVPPASPVTPVIPVTTLPIGILWMMTAIVGVLGAIRLRRHRG